MVMMATMMIMMVKTNHTSKSEIEVGSLGCTYMNTHI